jgi:hypothetical protein
MIACAVLALLSASIFEVDAQPAAGMVYRCPTDRGLAFTDTLTPLEALAKGCRPLTGAPARSLDSRWRR